MTLPSEEDNADAESLGCDSGNGQEAPAATSKGNDDEDTRRVKQERVKDEPREETPRDDREKPRVEVIDLCDSDDDAQVIKVSSRGELRARRNEARVKQEEEKTVTTTTSADHQPEVPPVMSSNSENEQTRRVSGPEINADANTSGTSELSFEERAFKLREREARVERMEIAMEWEKLRRDEAKARSA